MARDASSASVRRSRIGSVLLSSICLCLAPAAAVAAAALHPAAGAVSQSSESRSELQAQGRNLYTSLCARCHGDDGDATDYPGIVPLAGIDLRLPPGRIADFSAPFVGRTFKGPEAQALVAYLATLHGAKGFANPGYLFSANLLHHKLPKRETYRVLDARPATAYEHGHVPNAIRWPLEGEEAASGRRGFEDDRRALAQSGVSEDTFVVVYDESGGPAAASVWWSLQELGHRRAAVLDGGLRAWQEAGQPLTRQPLRIEAAPVLDQHPSLIPAVAGQPIPLYLGRGSGADGIAFDWRRTVDENGLLPADTIEGYLKNAGFRFPGTYRVGGDRQELGFLLWILRLTGREPTYVQSTGLLTVAEPR